MADIATARPADRGHFRRMMLQILCTGVLAWLLLGVYRGVILETPETAGELLGAVPAGIAASFYDLLFIAGVTAAALGLLLAARRSRIASLGVVMLFYGIILVSLAWGFANINLVKMLGEPFTFQWLVYGDFLQNADARNAMADAFNLSDFSILCGASLAVLVLGYVAARLWLGLGPLAHRLVLGAIVLCVGIAAVGSAYHVEAQALPVTKLQNPVVHFIESALVSSTPVVFTMPVSANAPDTLPVSERPGEVSGFRRPEPNPVKNVLVFMMESVPAKYVEAFGGTYPVTPNIAAHVDQSVRFDRIYAHAPSTNYSIFSLFTSMYNDISYYGMTGSYPYLKFDSLTNALQQHGFRTGFFWSADSRFQGVDEFLLNKGLDVIKDYRDQDCGGAEFKISTDSFKNADYTSDLCTARTIAKWMNEPSDKPFFAMMFTAMTHYPYRVTEGADSRRIAPSAGGGELVHYADDEKFNEYLNALRIGDMALGQVLASLKASGKLDSTLVVILGDHGEAFGEHGNYVHASALYEENVHIPLMMINRYLFHGEVDDTVGGVIDIAPTIFDVLGLPLPGQWQGRSLFSTDKPNRTFFFAPWRGVQFGYREDDRKVIFNATTGKIEVYDLKADPGEKQDLFVTGVSDATQLLQPIASWVQSHKQRIAAVIAGGPRPAGCGITELVIDAGGTAYQAPPRFELRFDGKLVATLDAAGVPSTAATSQQSLAEMQTAAASTEPLTIDLPADANPQQIEIRYVNDLWGTPDKPGDRNLFIKSVRVNGLRIPDSRLHVDAQSHGITDSSGTAMYENGSLWIDGPFGEGCAATPTSG